MIVFALAHCVGGDFFEALLTTNYREYTSVLARKQYIDASTITSASTAIQSATAAMLTGLSSVLLSLASMHESSCLFIAAITIATMDGTR